MKKTTSLDVQRCVALAFFVSSLCIYAQPLATYDLSADYSTNANPNGVWAYGWKETTTGAFSNHTFFRITFNEAGGQDWVWARYSNDQSFIMRNGSSFDGSAGGGQARWAPGQMIIGPGHPLHNDNYGGVRFTVPNNAQGTHLVQVRVDDLYVGALSGDTDFHVVRSGVELVGVNIPASATTFTNGFGYTNQTILMAGETLDFLVGRGLDNSYNGSTLKINLTIKRLDEALAPPMFLIPLQGLTVYPGDNTALVAQVTGNAPLTYQWFFENNLIPDATNASLTLLNCQPSTVGNYTLVVSNMVGSVTSSPAMLTVTTNPSVNVTPTNAVVYITTSTSFVASASGPSPLTFQWQFNGSNLTGATNNVLALTNLTLAQSGAYQCVVMNPYASTTSAPVTLTVQTTSLTCVDDFDPVIDSNQWFSVGGAIATNYGGSVSGTKALVFTATSGTRQVTTRPLNTTSGGTISYYLRTGTNTYVYYWDRPDYVNEYTLLEYSVNQGSTWTTITNHSLVISNWTQFQMPIPAAAQSSYTLFRWRQYAYTTATSYNGDNWALEDVNINAMPTSPTITTGPSNQTVTVGGTVAFTSSATSTTPMMYQWYFSGQTINNATNSGLTLLNVTSNNAGGYFAVVSNLGGSATSGVATLTVIPPPSIVAVPSLTATPGTDLVVPITLVSRGTENVVSFSLAFDPARLSFRQVTMGEGAALAFPTFNSLQASNGLVGISLMMDPGLAFTAGTQEIARVSFGVSVVSTPTLTPLTFTNTPIIQEISSVEGPKLNNVIFTNAQITIPVVELEGDITGDYIISSADVTLVGRLVAGLDQFTNATMFQRADCAPLSTSGDGKLTVADWVQAVRFNAGLDAWRPAGGPTGSLSKGDLAKAPKDGKSANRKIYVNDLLLQAGQTNVVPVYLETQGGESACGFSLIFNPAVLKYVGYTTGSGASGATVRANTNQATAGRVGFAMMLPSVGQTFPVGKLEMVQVRFEARTDARADSDLAFANQPVYVDLADAQAQSLGLDITSGKAYMPMVRPGRSAAIGGTNCLSFSWSTAMTNYVLEMVDGLSGKTWGEVPVTAVTNAGNVSLNIPLTNKQGFFRLRKQGQ